MSPDTPEVYPRYLADSRRPQNSVGVMGVIGDGIAESGDARFALDLGARIPLARLEDVARRLRWLFYLEGGYFGQFDIGNSLDEIGWDGWFAGQLGFDGGSPLRFKLGLRHLSSHLGDEHVLRTGR